MALSDRGFKPKGLIGGRGGQKKVRILQKWIEWAFFCDKWRNLIHGCLCNEHFGVLVDGVPHGYFPASRGLRQGR